MLETLSMNEKLTFQSLTEEEKSQRGILGRLSGPVASFKTPTRNGRKYSESLWEKVFDAPLVKELFSRGGIPGELDHPDRDETCSEKIAIMMPEPPKKDRNGHLVAYFDIIDTPCGRIASTLAKYGFQFGISSRGSGDTFTDYDGQESVDPDTYTLNAFDLVLIPACKDAVLSLTESLHNEKITLKKALNEALEKCNENDRKIMTETLNNLEIDYTSAEETNEELANTAIDNISEESNQKEAADNVGALMITELQEALQKQVELELQIKSLQEQLSVCYTKENRYVKFLETAKIDLSAANDATEAEKVISKKLAEKIETLKNIISQQNLEIKSLNENLSNKDNDIKSLQEQLKVSENTRCKLVEGVSTKDTQSKILIENLKTENHKLATNITHLKTENEKLNESLHDLQNESQIFKSQNNSKLIKAQELIEKYKAIAKTAVDKYIYSQASRYGFQVSEIKNRLQENYSFKDIDATCETLQRYKLNLNNLPFDTRNGPIKMKIRESKEVLTPNNSMDIGVDDVVDEMLGSFISNL